MKYRIRIIHERTSRRFRGRYKGHEIEITRADRKGLRVYGWYIMVWAPSGALCYDGYWPSSLLMEGPKTMDEAIEQALRGSLLIPDIDSQ